MENKLWVFGDSFTKGGGLAPFNTFYKETYKGQKIWPDIVGEKLNLDVINHGYSWCNTELLIRNILYYLPDITHNDIVIFSNTDVCSTLLSPMRNDNIVLRASRPFDEGYPFVDTKEKQITKEYVENCIVPYEKEFDRFWIESLTAVYNMLVRLNIKTVFWTRDLWKQFESIEQATQGRIVNIHWSWKGHEQMADYILKQLNND